MNSLLFILSSILAISFAAPSVRFVNSLVAYPNIMIVTNLYNEPLIPFGEASDYKVVEAGVLSIQVFSVGVSYDSNGNATQGGLIYQTSYTLYFDRFYTIAIWLDTDNKIQIDPFWDNIELGVEYTKDDAVFRVINLAPGTTNAALYQLDSVNKNPTSAVISFVGYYYTSQWVVLEVGSQTSLRVTVDGKEAPLTQQDFSGYSPQASYTIYTFANPNATGEYIATIQYDREFSAMDMLKANLVLLFVLIVGFVMY